MNKHPMLSVKEAANLMGCDERWVRERLNQGQLKGEKKNIGLKEKWFVYAGEVEAALARRAGTTHLNSSEYLAAKPMPPNTEPTNQTVEPETVAVDTEWSDGEEHEVTDGNRDQTRLIWLQSQREALMEVAEEMMAPIRLQLEERNALIQQKDEMLQAATYQLGYAKGRMQEQEEKIKLLPDFQARAERAIKLEREAAEANERAEALAEDLAKRTVAEEQARKLVEETNFELRKVKEQRELEANQNATKLADLEKLVQELQKPKATFWKKFFGVQ
jgi:hypothetical protein